MSEQNTSSSCALAAGAANAAPPQPAMRTTTSSAMRTLDQFFSPVLTSFPPYDTRRRGGATCPPYSSVVPSGNLESCWPWMILRRRQWRRNAQRQAAGREPPVQSTPDSGRWMLQARRRRAPPHATDAPPMPSPPLVSACETGQAAVGAAAVDRPDL